MATVADVRRIVALDHGLATVSVRRPDGTVLSTVVNGGVVEHPVSGAPVVAFVGRPATRKIAHLRANPHATLLWRAGWAWVAVEGPVELIGPDDRVEGVAAKDVPGLLRAVYSAAGGGEHEDWAEYDRVVATERRMAVLVAPRRIYVNP